MKHPRNDCPGCGGSKIAASNLCRPCVTARALALRGWPKSSQPCPSCDGRKAWGTKTCNRCRRAREADPARFWALADKSNETGCWPFIGKVDTSGYGRHRLLSEGRAHRIAYRLLVGPIPNGLQIDHLCRNRRCVNPAHMEPVTREENLRRAVHVAPAFCPQGHPRTPENSYYWSGVRHCRACRLAKARREYWARKTVAA